MADAIPERTRGGGRSTLAPLSHPVFRAVWGASLVSNFGGLIQSVGASWLMMSISGSPDMVALVQASVTLPFMVLSLMAGAIADNFDRRIVMLYAQCFMLLASLALALFAWVGWITPWLLLFFTFLIGCGGVLNTPAWQASVRDMVPREHLPGAIALNSMGFNIARSIGPAIGGAIVAAAGAAAAFAINAVSYIGLIAVLARWRPDVPKSSLPRETLGLAMMAGLRYVAMSPGIRVVLLRAGTFGIGAGAVTAMMPLIARDLIGGGPLTYGALLGAFGLGAVPGALSSAWLRARFPIETIVSVAGLLFAAACAIAGISPYLPLTMAVLALCGGAWVLILSNLNVSVQLAAPRWVVGRALALYQTAAFGGMALGAWGWGELAARRGVGATLLISALAQLVVALAGRRLPLPVIADQNLDPLSRWREPETAVPIEPRSGPVVITIEYRIREDRIRDFLAVMAERRRIRMRDGARHWTLLRDLGDPELWIERYHTPTWLDYVRHNQRRTFADVENSDQLMALHHGAGGPRVHRMIERQTGSLPETRAAGQEALSEPLTDPARSA